MLTLYGEFILEEATDLLQYRLHSQQANEWQENTAELLQASGNNITGCSEAHKAHMELCVASNGNYFEGKNRQI